MPRGRQGQAVEPTKSAMHQLAGHRSAQEPGWLVECLRLGGGHAIYRPARSLHPGCGGRTSGGSGPRPTSSRRRGGPTASYWTTRSCRRSSGPLWAGSTPWQSASGSPDWSSRACHRRGSATPIRCSPRSWRRRWRAAGSPATRRPGCGCLASSRREMHFLTARPGRGPRRRRSTRAMRVLVRFLAYTGLRAGEAGRAPGPAPEPAARPVRGGRVGDRGGRPARMGADQDRRAPHRAPAPLPGRAARRLPGRPAPRP